MASRKASLAFDSNYQQVFQYPLQYIPIDPINVCAVILDSLPPASASLFPSPSRTSRPVGFSVLPSFGLGETSSTNRLVTYTQDRVPFLRDVCAYPPRRKPHLNVFGNPVKDSSSPRSSPRRMGTFGLFLGGEGRDGRAISGGDDDPFNFLLIEDTAVLNENYYIICTEVFVIFLTN